MARKSRVKANLPEGLQDALLDFENYLELELSRSSNTVDSYISDLNLFCEFLLKKSIKNFKDVDEDALVAWLGELSRECRASTQARRLSALKTFATQLVDAGIWEKNYSKLLARPKSHRQVPEVLSAGEIDTIIDTAASKASFESVRDKAMLELVYSSGLRVSEICSLKFSDMDLENAILRVHGKGGKTRLVPFGKLASQSITEYLKVRMTMPKHFADELFITRRGKKLSRKTFWYNLKKYSAKSGTAKNVKPHMLRHSFATHLLQNGANLMSISEMLGHSDLSTTQIYTQLVNDDIIEEYKRAQKR